MMLLSFATIAERLHYTGVDAERSVRRLFDKHGVPFIRRGGGVYFATEQQFNLLLESMTCSRSGDAENTSISAGRSVSGAKPASSKSTLAAQIAAKLQRPTDQSSRPKFETSSFTVLEDERKA